MSIDSDSGDQLAHDFHNEGDFPTYLSRPLVAGERIRASVDHCRLGKVGSPEMPVSAMFGERGSPFELPTPIIDPDTAIECRKKILVRDLVPGVLIRVYDGNTFLADKIATGTQAWVDLGSAMKPTWNLQAEQALCYNVSGLSPVVNPKIP